MNKILDTKDASIDLEKLSEVACLFLNNSLRGEDVIETRPHVLLQQVSTPQLQGLNWEEDGAIATIVSPDLEFRGTKDRAAYELTFNPDRHFEPFAEITLPDSVTEVQQFFQLPASFDLRSSGYVTPVKHQGQCDSCWTFSTYGALESSILMDGGPVRDLSENHLKNYHGFDWGPCEGGNYYISEAYLSRWSGPVDEADDPYHDQDDRPSPGGPPQYYVREMHRYDTDGEMKNALMQVGALSSYMYWDDLYYDASNYTYYYNGSGPGNHCITIVGWDDNKATAAPNLGAWLCKNSWGTSFGDGGYFWIAYDDLNGANSAESFHEAVAADSFSNVYYHDEFGQVSSCDSPYAFNAFNPTQTESLSAVGFFTLADNTEYEIKIYDDFSSGILANLLASTSGLATYGGYHTIDLPSAVSLTAGDRFYVALHLTNGGTYPQAIDMSVPGYSSASTASPGQSYYSFNGLSWTDLTTEDPTANFCIKALTSNQPALSIGDAIVNEGDGTATLMVNLSATITDTVTVNYATTDGTASSGNDYQQNNGTLTFSPNQTSQEITINLIDDAEEEGNEIFKVNLFNPTNAIIADGEGVVTILANDARLSIGDAIVNEGDGTAILTVNLSRTSTQTVTVNYATADGTASSGNDYQQNNGTLTFSPNQTSQEITINLIDDAEEEGNEIFQVNLFNPTNAIIGDGEGVVTILANDPNPLNTPIYRFQNRDIAGTYLFVGEQERQDILRNFPNFIEEGFAFNVAVEPGDNLIAMNRFQNSNVPGTYLYAGEEESRNIRQNFPNFSEEGLAFYVYGSDANVAADFYRFQNTSLLGTYLFVGEQERQSILSNFPNFAFEGAAFEAGI